MSHDIANHMRYMLMSAARLVGDEDELSALAHALPYVLYGRQSWSSPVDASINADMIQHARAVANKYGVTLSCEPLQAGAVLLSLAADLIASTEGAAISDRTQSLYGGSFLVRTEVQC